MNIHEEGEYYLSLVRKFRTEYNSKNLGLFCRDQKVSYSKMLHCLRNDSYRKPCKAIGFDKEEVGLRPLIIEGVVPPQSEPEANVVLPPPFGRIDIMDVEICIGTKLSLRIGSCDSKILVSLIKEMETAL